jgi:maltooligosyltrehalose trehalohydrolase
VQHHRIMHEWYAELIRLRKSHPALRQASKANQTIEFSEDAKTLTIERWNGDLRLLAIFNFSPDHRDAPAHDSSHVLLNSADQRWLGLGGEPLGPSSCLVLGW